MTHTLWVKYMQNLLHLQAAISQASIQEQIERHGQDANSDAQNVTGPLSTSAPTSLSKADLNGASLRGAFEGRGSLRCLLKTGTDVRDVGRTVVDSTNQSLKGLQGIVVQETEQTIMLGTPTWMETGTLKEKKRHRKRHTAKQAADGGMQDVTVEVERNPVVRREFPSNFALMESIHQLDRLACSPQRFRNTKRSLSRLSHSHRRLRCKRRRQ